MNLSELLYQMESYNVQVSMLEIPCQGEECENTLITGQENVMREINELLGEGLFEHSWESEHILCPSCKAKKELSDEEDAHWERELQAMREAV